MVSKGVDKGKRKFDLPLNKSELVTYKMVPKKLYVK